MHIDPRRPPATPESLAALHTILEATAEYSRTTGRSATEDMELLGFLENMQDELKGTPGETFVALSERGFNLYGDSKREEYYYDATRDYVSDAVGEAGLKGRWCIVCWSYEREHVGQPCGETGNARHVYEMPPCQNTSAAGRRRKTDGT